MPSLATDAGLVAAPVRVTSFHHSAGERNEVVIDFATYAAATRIVLRYTSPRNNVNSVDTNKAMAFDVVGDAFDPTGNGVPASSSRHSRRCCSRRTQAMQAQKRTCSRSGGEWTFNGVTWDCRRGGAPS